MTTTFNDLIEQISSNPLFLKLKGIVENAQGWHDHESVFDHSIKTANIAKQECEGKFFTNEVARKSFLNWMDEDFFGIKRKNIAILTALLHDCGKLLQYKEGEEITPLIMTKPQTTDQTLCPGHEYWGGLVVKEIFKDINLNTNVKEHIATLVKLHDTFNNYFPGKENWNLHQLIQDAKSRAEGYYKETMFNSYCDCYNASAFSYSKSKIEEVFNEPDFYISRTYFIPK